jgi:glycosyltransferase involved in cell wall biosynthesis
MNCDESGTDAAPPTIAIVCDTAPYPVRSGDNKRLSEMIEILRTRGWRVHLILTALMDRRSRKLCYERVDALHVYNGKGLKTRCRNLLRRSVRFADRIGQTIGIPPAEEIANRILGRRIKPLVIDYWQRYPYGLNIYLARLARKFQWKAVIVEFIWLHSAIDRLPRHILRVLDTHDIQHQRLKDFMSRGINFPLEITRDQESRIFNYFDAVIAIQLQETDLIRRMCPNLPVLTVGTACTDSHPSPDTPIPGRILYIGGYNGANIDGLNHFLRTCWTQILKDCPHAHLHICGYIYRAFLNETFPNVEFVGHVSEVAPQYAYAELVINPVWIGTGLKIKTVEALTFGKPLVTTSKGTEGMHPDVAQACIIATEDKDFVNSVVHLLSNTKARSSLAEATTVFSAAHLSASKTYDELLDFLTKTR